MSMFEITRGQILRYMFLPEILPRLNNFLKDGFQSLAVFMALIYRAVKLLPANHPYLKKDAYGQFNVWDVIAAASNNLKFSGKYIDQIIVFFALLAGMIILVLQFLILLASIMTGRAIAADMPSDYSEFFVTQNPNEDLAFKVLDAVFGVPELFSDRADPSDFHLALQGMFTLYSTGLLVIAGIIIAYFIFVIVAETAQTGTPFGKRYNHAWAPIRLVIGIGLLIPIGSGFNAAQWVTLYSAKLGSGFATVGWQKFNEEVNDKFIEDEAAVALPNIPDLKDLASFMMTVHACKAAYSIVNGAGFSDQIDAYQVNRLSNKSQPIRGIGHINAVNFSSGRDIVIVFGIQGDQYSDYPANIFPICGEVVIANHIPKIEEEPEEGGGKTDSIEVIVGRYFTLVTRAWEDSLYKIPKAIPIVQNMMENRLTSTEIPHKEPSKMDLQLIQNGYKNFIQEGAEIAKGKAQEELYEDDDYKKYGWAGAGIWYNRIANVNGILTNALLSKPQIKKYPIEMEYTCKENRQANTGTEPTECYKPFLSKGRPVDYPSDKSREIASALNDVFQIWKDDGGNTKNIFVDTINLIFGTDGLFSMCENANVHPLSQLATTGKSLIEAAIRNIGFSMGLGAAGLFIGHFGPAASAASGFFGTIASIGLLLGFILYYMIPLMPFLYFFFAVGTWVRGIFEAMVGVPLWALAHLRIDGQGLPGDAASAGYFLIFEIFLRPILILFGLMASMLIFAAMIKVLNEIFYLAASNMSGFDGQAATTCGQGASPDAASGGAVGSMEYFRGPIDQLFFTVLYAIIVYLTGMSCFKLIDNIPNQILRWLGSSARTFGDDAGQVADEVMQKISIGGYMVGGQVGGIASSAGEVASKTAAGIQSLGKEG